MKMEWEYTMYFYSFIEPSADSLEHNRSYKYNAYLENVRYKNIVQRNGLLK